MENRTYIAIDLKSFYASQECIERGVDPLTTNLVVADMSRTEKTICLAVTPSLKAYGVPGRARLFEAIQKVKEANALRRLHAPGGKFTGKSFDATALAENPALEIDFLIAPPKMASYMAASARIYEIYLKYVAPEDIHVYSIDEVFLDVTSYLPVCGLTARAFAEKIIQDVLENTGITATVGIGTNLYLCKVAMDITAKRIPPDKNGARIAELDERTYREKLWNHRPLTDFWRVGRGYAKKLESYGLFTMGDIARCSLGKPSSFHNEALLYKLFGVNAELLIDHAWGWEPCTIADIKAFKPDTNSVGSGQVLQSPYPFDKARIVVQEMADHLVLDLVEKGIVTNQMVLTIGYDRMNMEDPEIREKYDGPVTTDPYGRKIPKHAHGTENLKTYTASTQQILEAVTALYDRIVDPNLLIRRINLVAAHVVAEDKLQPEESPEQLDLFTDYAEKKQAEQQRMAELEEERLRQQASLSIRKKYGKNAILRGLNLKEGATARERNGQIGGHKAQ